MHENILQSIGRTPLRLGNHGDSHSVFDAPAGIHRLHFDVDGDGYTLTKLP